MNKGQKTTRKSKRGYKVMGVLILTVICIMLFHLIVVGTYYDKGDVHVLSTTESTTKAANIHIPMPNLSTAIKKTGATIKNETNKEPPKEIRTMAETSLKGKEVDMFRSTQQKQQKEPQEENQQGVVYTKIEIQGVEYNFRRLVPLVKRDGYKCKTIFALWET